MSEASIAHDFQSKNLGMHCVRNLTIFIPLVVVILFILRLAEFLVFALHGASIRSHGVRRNWNHQNFLHEMLDEDVALLFEDVWSKSHQLCQSSDTR